MADRFNVATSSYTANATGVGDTSFFNMTKQTAAITLDLSTTAPTAQVTNRGTGDVTLQGGLPGGQVANISYPNFSSIAGLKVNGSAAQSSSLLRLTPNSPNMAGSAFYNTAITIATDTSFNCHFSFSVAPNGGADGMTFIVQADSRGASAIGSGGGGKGYTGIKPSFAVVMVMYNENTCYLAADGSTSRLATYTPSFDLGTASNAHMWVDYTSTGGWKAYISTTNTKPATAALSYTAKTLASIGTSVFFGFTAATGSTNESHDVTSWSLTGQSAAGTRQTISGGNIILPPKAIACLVRDTTDSSVWLPS